MQKDSDSIMDTAFHTKLVSAWLYDCNYSFDGAAGPEASMYGVQTN